MFTNPHEHLEAELRRLDLLLHREILRLRATYELSLDEFRGLYISDEQVDRLVNETLGEQTPDPDDVAALTRRAAALRHENTERLPAHLPWKRLVDTFDLSPQEEDVLLIAAAPEIDLKYETLYAYLNDNVNRKHPTFDGARRLVDCGKGELRRLLLPEGTLFGTGLLEMLPSSQQSPSWLATGFSMAPPVVRFILGVEVWNESLTSFARRSLPSKKWEDLSLSSDPVGTLRRTAQYFDGHEDPPPVLVFEGRRGAGRAQAAAALCHAMGQPLLRIDLDALLADNRSLPDILQALALQQRLEPAGLYLERVEALVGKDGPPSPRGRHVLEHLAMMQETDARAPVMLACASGTPWRDLLSDRRHLAFSFDDPDYGERLELWRRHLAEHDSEVPASTLERLADRFVLNSGQIRQIVTTARDTQAVRENEDGPPSPELLFEAARDTSSERLGKLAAKAKLIHTWDDLVLPPAPLQQVEAIAAAIRHRHRVYTEWGFEQRIAAGKGLKVLFSGTSGTGKTMTAGVIARDLGLDLYKVDLSGVVSKYIGETEKNLDRIFRAARASSAILFFDEADALFGKRSEVKDAHDRYANIETSYLLQKMEEHEGAVILATNLRKNIDEAFSRRMHYVVEFPMPDELHRERLWRGMFPAEVPLGDDVDFRFLARQFTLSGGDIQNVALDAAFRAAHDGQVVGMRELVRAVDRQLKKQGRIASKTDFKQYHTLLAHDAGGV